MEGMAIYFHGNYGMHRGRMARIVARLRRFPEATHREIGAFFGYSQSYAARYRSWLHKCGLVLRGRPFELTEWGRVIVEHDRALESQATQWLLHWELVTHPTRTEVWHRFFHDFLSRRASFSEHELMEFLTGMLGSRRDQPVGSDSRMTRSVMNKLIECYTAPQALGRLGIVVEASQSPEGNGLRFLKGVPEAMGPWDSPEDWTVDFLASHDDF